MNRLTIVDVARVDAQDVETARKLIAAAVHQAGEAWLPANVIAEALACELVEYTSHHAEAATVAALLVEVAGLLGHERRVQLDG